MKKILFIIFSCFFLFTMVGCSRSEFKEKDIKPYKIKETTNLKLLSNVQYPSKDYSNEYIDETLKKALDAFGEKVIKEAFKENSNNIFSPISLYMALSMLLEGVGEEAAFNELMNLLGLDLETLEVELKNAYINDYYTNEDGRLYMSNSVWVKNDYPVKESYVKTLEEKFFAESYFVDFTKKEVKKAIVDWLNHYTEDLLHLTPENYEIEDDLAVVLFNTIYFNNKWAVEFKESSEINDTFYLSSNDIVTSKSMTHSIRNDYLVTDEYTVVRDSFYNGNKITYIMPNDYDTQKVIDNGYTKYLNELLRGEVILTTFQFETFSSYDLKETLQNLGVNGIFVGEPLTKMGDHLVTSVVKQDAGIKLSRLGVEAAAVTRIGNKATSAGPVEEPVYIKLDKPFVYIITDSNNLPLFIGTMVNPTI